MNNSMRLGFMAVVAVSGSMAFVVHQVHKRLLSNFMEKIEHEMGGILCAHGQKNLCGSEKHQAKKKVRFSKEALEEKSYGRSSKMISTRVGRMKVEEIWKMKNVERWSNKPKLEEMMPPNRKVLYKGIMKYRNNTICGRLPF
ncbi:hypothetical protein PHAVU_001G198200 [Phaseolus vulgaris]|uniref:Transmembrane protein n=1 Tax=Phaseolus vulgaris TaxID=3885 RepID=V7D0F9_PHAVU|nr:hypothetical protein PHAVU_001G198200g [Phaseolus vulgaris]ESW35000.1 hypothetical protein PHAVU_001G198200g [Phaseolus vulgaris]